MTAVFIALGVIAYLVLLVDWKEFRGVLGQGGWAAVVYYGLVGFFIYMTIVTPAATTAPGLHH